MDDTEGHGTGAGSATPEDKVSVPAATPQFLGFTQQRFLPFPPLGNSFSHQTVIQIQKFGEILFSWFCKQPGGKSCLGTGGQLRTARHIHGGETQQGPLNLQDSIPGIPRDTGQGISVTP